jgi:hypothetical protein
MDRDSLLRVALVQEILYLSFVRQPIRHIIVLGLTVGYLTVTLLGHYGFLAHLLNTGAECQQVTSEKKSQPIDSRPYWTQKKHLPLSTKTPEWLAETANTASHFFFDQAFGKTRVPPSTDLPGKVFYVPYQPRDPPSA